MKKICTKCKIEKELLDFKPNKQYKDKYDCCCKDCFKEYNIKWREKNKEYASIKSKEWRRENPEQMYINKENWDKENKEHINQYRIKYQSTKEYKLRKKEHDKKYKEKNLEKIKSIQKEYYNKNKKLLNKKAVLRKNNDPKLRIIHNLRNRIRLVLKGKSKSKKTLELLGCSLEELKNHLEKQFKSNMSWKNYGKEKGCWSIDHIYPLSKCHSIEEIEKMNHYTNLQPLWHWEENIKKGNKI